MTGGRAGGDGLDIVPEETSSHELGSLPFDLAMRTGVAPGKAAKA